MSELACYDLFWVNTEITSLSLYCYTNIMGIITLKKVYHSQLLARNSGTCGPSTFEGQQVGCYLSEQHIKNIVQ